MSVCHATGRGPRFKDRSGERHGMIEVLSLDRMEKCGRIWKSFWKCRCDCGQECVKAGTNIASGNTKSCGCFRNVGAALATKTHGQTETRLYSIWQNMLKRCCKPSNPAYKWYGARGITVCEEWRKSFASFSSDMGQPPSSRHSIDRKDNSRGYCKENCRWATPMTQSRNSRQNVHVEHNGESLCISEWSERLGIKMHTLYARLFVYGWSIERAMTTPVQSTANIE